MIRRFYSIHLKGLPRRRPGALWHPGRVGRRRQERPGEALWRVDR